MIIDVTYDGEKKNEMFKYVCIFSMMQKIIPWKNISVDFFVIRSSLIFNISDLQKLGTFKKKKIFIIFS